jgi:hypothetical protein
MVDLYPTLTALQALWLGIEVYDCIDKEVVALGGDLWW